MKRIKRAAIAGLAIAPALLLGACEQEGPAERAGERIDEATNDARDAASDAVDKVGEKIEQAGDDIREATDD